MGLYQATLHGNQDGQTIDVNTGWLTATATNSADAGIIADRVYQGWASYVMDDLVDDYEITSCDVYGVDDPTRFGTFSGSAAGGNPDPPAPMFVVGNVQLRTGVRGRSYQGRFGLPGLAANYLDAANGNMINAGTAAVLEVDLDNWNTHVETGPPSPKLCVISRVSGGTPRIVPVGTEVTTRFLSLTLGSRVSRKG